MSAGPGSLFKGFTGCDLLSVYGTVNGNVTFSPSKPTSEPFTEILWTKQKDKVVEWEQAEQKDFPPFEKRVRLNTTSGELTVLNLRPSDEDEYKIESLPPVPGATRFFLHVLEPLPPPTLNCTSANGNITIRCSTLEHHNRHPQLITYSWDCSSEQCKNISIAEISFKIGTDLRQEVKCIVKNPLSRNASSIILAACVSSRAHSRHRLPLIAAPFAIIITCIVLYRNGTLKCGRETDRTNSS
ncbi:lymphocyte function-associated antigen 3 isoform X2 [Carlito syrichta]|uniref:Lymphocyte function-associated antigen 3 isoform X2 n=1 Tax=Carlito syrichta TaxID=1868482 RepID=A0A1U7USH9_CARSF|nr:lymphocyte function-associated antigen 3 isoform X2 [Carlito syrichta]